MKDSSLGEMMKILFIILVPLILICGESLAGEIKPEDQILQFDSVTADGTLSRLELAKSLKDLNLVREELKSIAWKSEPQFMTYIENKNNDGQKRFLVLDALFKTFPPEKQRAGLQSLFRKDTDMTFRARCAESLGIIGDNKSKVFLKSVLYDAAEPPRVQMSAAWGLAYMGDPAGKQRALQAIFKADAWADTAIRVLEKLNAKDTISALEEHADRSENNAIQDSCNKAAIRIRMVGESIPQQANLLRGVLLKKRVLNNSDIKDGLYNFRQWAARRLGEMGEESAYKVLCEISKDENAPGQESARSGLYYGNEIGHWKKEDIYRCLTGE